MALRKLNVMIEKNATNYILDADVKGFFDHIDHEWAVKFIGAKIKDPNILRLVRKMLKAGIIEDFQYEETEEGSGQGGLCRAPHKFPYVENNIMRSKDAKTACLLTFPSINSA